MIQLYWVGQNVQSDFSNNFQKEQNQLFGYPVYIFKMYTSSLLFLLAFCIEFHFRFQFLIAIFEEIILIFCVDIVCYDIVKLTEQAYLIVFRVLNIYTFIIIPSTLIYFLIVASSHLYVLYFIFLPLQYRESRLHYRREIQTGLTYSFTILQTIHHLV